VHCRVDQERERAGDCAYETHVHSAKSMRFDRGLT
jgi:hypothetical protein